MLELILVRYGYDTCVYASADINKFLWMVRIGGNTERGRHIKEPDYYTKEGEFRVDKAGSPTLLNCFMYKMSYYRFGSVYTEHGTLCTITVNSHCCTTFIVTIISKRNLFSLELFISTILCHDFRTLLKLIRFSVKKLRIIFI